MKQKQNTKWELRRVRVKTSGWEISICDVKLRTDTRTHLATEKLKCAEGQWPPEERWDAHWCGRCKRRIHKVHSENFLQTNKRSHDWKQKRYRSQKIIGPKAGASERARKNGQEARWRRGEDERATTAENIQTSGQHHVVNHPDPSTLRRPAPKLARCHAPPPPGALLLQAGDYVCPTSCSPHPDTDG